MSDENDLLRQMQDMLQAVQSAQEDLDEIEVIGTAGGGAIRVVATGQPEITRVEVSEEALEDREMLEDLIVAAVNDALRNAARVAQERLGGLAGGLQIPGLTAPLEEDDEEED